MPDRLIHRSGARRAVRGISLVETLVALLVLSIGLMGVAALLLQSVRGSRTALFRTQAVNLVSDMADRIRANANAGPAYTMETYGEGPAERGCVSTAADDGGANCSVNELAEDDLARWEQAVREALPGDGEATPVAVVEHFAAPDASTPERYRVLVAWQEPGETPEEYSYESDVVIMPRSAP